MSYNKNINEKKKMENKKNAIIIKYIEAINILSFDT